MRHKISSLIILLFIFSILFVHAAYADIKVVIRPDESGYGYNEWYYVLSDDRTILIRYQGGGVFTVPSTVTTIGENAFAGQGVTSVKLPSGIAAIPNGAFDGCSGLSNVNIPYGVISIGESAFLNCTSLSSITIPSSVTSIGDYSFRLFIEHDVFDEYGQYAGDFVDADENLPVTINCYRDSYAQSWAQEHGFNYTLLEGEESTAPDPTPTDEGGASPSPSPSPTPEPASLALSLISADSGTAVDPLYFADDLLHSDQNADSYAFQLFLTVKNAAGKAVTTKLTLPAGLTFDKAIVTRTKTVSLGGNGNAKETATYPVYGYSCAQTADSLQIKAEGDVSAILSLKIKYLEMLTMTLSETLDGPALTSLTDMDGILRSSASSESSKLCLNVTVKGVADRAIDIDFTLPGGLSFSPDAIVTQGKQTYGGEGVNALTKHYDVYAVYQKPLPETLEISASGGVSATLSLPVTRNTAQILVQGNASYRDTVDLDWEAAFASGGYSQKMAVLACDLAYSVYVESNVRQSLKNLGFTDIEYHNNASRYYVGYCLAQKRIVINGIPRTLVTILVRGTDPLQEWLGNLLVLSQTEHATFSSAAGVIMDSLEAYCQGHDIEQAQSLALVCGHSRGGAVANIIGHRLNQQSWYQQRTYTFATPNSALVPVNDGNIYNFLFGGDLAAYVPQGYGKYGTSYVVGGSASVPGGVGNAYASLTGKSYVWPDNSVLIDSVVNIMGEDASAYGAPVVKLADYIIEKVSSRIKSTTDGESAADNGSAIEDSDGLLSLDQLKRVLLAHSYENYISWVKGNGTSNAASYDMGHSPFDGSVARHLVRLNLSPSFTDRLKGFLGAPLALGVSTILHSRLARLGFNIVVDLVVVHCPVDVNVIDANGHIVASLVDHELVRWEEGEALAVTDGESDYILLPAGGDYHLEITGNNEGTMDIDMRGVSANLDVIDSDSFSDVPVQVNDSFVLEPDVDGLVYTELIADDGRIFIPDGRAAVETEKMLKIIGRFLPDYLGKENVNEIIQSVSNCINAEPDTNILFVSASADVGMYVLNSAQTLVASSYGTPFVNRASISLLRFGDTTVFVLPHSGQYTVGFSGIGAEAVDVGVGLFNPQFRLLDAASFSSEPIGLYEEIKLRFYGTSWLSSLGGARLVHANGEYLMIDRDNYYGFQLPDGLKVLGDEAFANDLRVTGNVYIPNQVTSIGSRAFYGTNIDTLYLPKGVIYIADDAFDGIIPDKPTLLCFADTYAYHWAIAHGYNVLPYKE